MLALTACQGGEELPVGATSVPAEASDGGGDSAEASDGGGGSTGDDRFPGLRAFPPLALAPGDAPQEQLVAGFETVPIDAVVCERAVEPGDEEPTVCSIEDSSVEYRVYAVRGVEGADGEPWFLVTAGPLDEDLAAAVADPGVAVGRGPTRLFTGDPEQLREYGLETRAQMEVDSLGAAVEVRECDATPADSEQSAPVTCTAVGEEDGVDLEVELYPAVDANDSPIVIGLVHDADG
jgi:hypothetical protein